MRTPQTGARTTPHNSARKGVLCNNATIANNNPILFETLTILKLLKYS
jgi:hypothetical protein